MRKSIALALLLSLHLLQSVDTWAFGGGKSDPSPKGRVDGVVFFDTTPESPRASFVGWTCDGTDYNQRVKLQVFFDKVRATGVSPDFILAADQPLPGGATSGDCGGQSRVRFRLEIPSQYFDGKAHSVQFMALNIGDKASDTELSNPSKWFRLPVPTLPHGAKKVLHFGWDNPTVVSDTEARLWEQGLLPTGERSDRPSSLSNSLGQNLAKIRDFPFDAYTLQISDPTLVSQRTQTIGFLANSDRIQHDCGVRLVDGWQVAAGNACYLSKLVINPSDLLGSGRHSWSAWLAIDDAQLQNREVAVLEVTLDGNVIAKRTIRSRLFATIENNQPWSPGAIREFSVDFTIPTGVTPSNGRVAFRLKSTGASALKHIQSWIYARQVSAIGDHVFSRFLLNYERVRFAVDQIQAAKAATGKQFFLSVRTGALTADENRDFNFVDQELWNTIIANWKVVAQVAVATGSKIFFDPEGYQSEIDESGDPRSPANRVPAFPFSRPDINPNDLFKDGRQPLNSGNYNRVRNLGRQLRRELNTLGAVDVLYLHSESELAGSASHVSWYTGYNPLSAAFMDGFRDADVEARSRNQSVGTLTGSPEAYEDRDRPEAISRWLQAVLGVLGINENVLGLPGNLPIVHDHDNFGKFQKTSSTAYLELFAGLARDDLRIWAKDNCPWYAYPAGNPPPYFGPGEFENSLRNQLKASHEWAWVYTENTTMMFNHPNGVAPEWDPRWVERRPLFLNAVTRSKSISLEVAGNVDGVIYEGGKPYLAGWACVPTRNEQLNLHLYSGATAWEGGQFRGSFTTSVSREAAVGAACRDSSQIARGFKIPLSPLSSQIASGTLLFVHAINSPIAQLPRSNGDAGAANRPLRGVEVKMP